MIDRKRSWDSRLQRKCIIVTSGVRIESRTRVRLHECCAIHYRSFNYLFSHAGVNPVKIFKVLEVIKSMRQLMRAVGNITSGRHRIIFQALFRYEACIRELSTNSSAFYQHALPMRQYQRGFGHFLSKRAMLFKSDIALSNYLGSRIPRFDPDLQRETFFCLVDTGKRIETFEIKKDIYTFLLELAKNKQTALAEIVNLQRQAPSNTDLAEVLRQLEAMRVFTNA